MKLNNNDKLKKYLREMRAAGNLHGISGTDIATASREKLEQWVDDCGSLSVNQILALDKEETSQPAAPAAQANQPAAPDMQAAMLALQSLFGGGQKTATLSNEDRAEIKASILAEITPPAVEISIMSPAGFKIELGAQHCLFPTLLTYIQAGIMPFITGGAGGGKTTAAEMVAKALELPFYSLSLSSQTGVHALLGYNDANGNYVSTDFRRAFAGGGVFILDEIDNGNANVLAVLNTALANGHCSFADKSIARHADFKLIATANTVGRGGSTQFVGRNPIDGATLDRFAMIHWSYDEAFEFKLAGNDQWVKRVQAIRKAAESLNSKLIISPRASINGAKLLAVGVLQSEVEEAVIFKGLPKDEKIKILASV